MSSSSSTESPPLVLTPPDISRSVIGRNINSRWISFIQNDELSCYSFYLPHYDDDDTSSTVVNTVGNNSNKHNDDESTTRTNPDNPNPDNPNPNPNPDPNPKTTTTARTSSIFTSKQLDEWFYKLHPSRYNNIDNDDDVDNASSASSASASAWTSASYKNQLLLRKTAWYTFNKECVCEYGYSDTWQKQIQSKEMINVLQEITEVVSSNLGQEEEELNCVNLNYYPSAGGIGFHADDEYMFDGLNRNTKIISLSLCCTTTTTSTCLHKPNNNYKNKNWGARKFQIKKRDNNKSESDDDDDNDDKNVVHEIILRHGDIVTMEGMFQKYYLHSIWPGDDDDNSIDYNDDDLCQGERINLTWRTIVKHLGSGGSSSIEEVEDFHGITCPLSLSLSSSSS
ncbi:hypothetical protein FRACYDRAFT_244294 [Fragilariopsis cylindrus CCMP1102]|uniref:Fe2OG dioxygenase domain-containing protein n=1 Tax=Fragilariopsis cylindrus CCMP1102 TaxID=635003 RepID=A0A1E7F1K2_9STRA|nr:hypothetical protein FRACYDRAFT_244294 [Fragilariopsis cylindrus CCMP1102]|eukprot:OEU12068.1 hypothetical protein FRACYDRAFT_244294 [Fragilariopsis cylindrus CCMP1102]